MQPVVELENLFFEWNAGQPCLYIPKLTISRGETLFVKGRSGSGKSTLLNLLGGTLTPSQGDIRLLGTTYSSLNSSALDAFRADHIGFIFQQFNLLPYLSVIENVSLSCHFSKRRHKRVLDEFSSLEEGAIRLLVRLGLTDKALYRRSVMALSVGQQQRVSAARALLGAPDIIIADEPTSALDPESRDQFVSLLLSQCEKAGSSLIFVSHDSSLEHKFSHVLELSVHADGGYVL